MKKKIFSIKRKFNAHGLKVQTRGQWILSITEIVCCGRMRWFEQVLGIEYCGFMIWFEWVSG